MTIGSVDLPKTKISNAINNAQVLGLRRKQELGKLDKIDYA